MVRSAAEKALLTSWKMSKPGQSRFLCHLIRSLVPEGFAMEPPLLEHRPLSFSELEDMLVRYAHHAEVTLVIEEALKRRLSDAPKGGA